MSQMILEYDEFCMFLLNIEAFNIMTPDFPYTSENKTKCTILYQNFRNFKWGWRAWLSDITFKGNPLKTIQVKFGLNWPSGFRGEDF